MYFDNIGGYIWRTLSLWQDFTVQREWRAAFTLVSCKSLRKSRKQTPLDKCKEIRDEECYRSEGIGVLKSVKGEEDRKSVV